eukprot:CAMPEP_0172601438 /NCGR_PEP_ID=MMETSP1068-20121228/21575_1 /TAXON_ID=35684 /ORGANISM="Pseudopedinella elastica, Strain CCMP716" /LENGTH=281 /DNA_ID=CAMNT_0013402411 /DNA_START=143 /DNA_END=988 /DNA_ORIENTATION=-
MGIKGLTHAAVLTVQLLSTVARAKPVGPMALKMRGRLYRQEGTGRSELRHDLLLRGGSNVLPQFPRVLTALDWIGTAVFAFSGTIAGGKDDMDLLGCTILSAVTAIGGGTIRDIFLGRTPVFWVEDPNFVRLCLVTSTLTFFLWPNLERMGGHADLYALKLADAIGMGAFAVLGAEVGVKMGFDPLINIFCGMMSATWGGVVRDVLCRRPVRIMYSHKSIYATPAILGAALFVYLDRAFPTQEGLDALCGFLLAVGLRIIAMTNGITLPCWLGKTPEIPSA